jgi:hypothetical protein
VAAAKTPPFAFWQHPWQHFADFAGGSPARMLPIDIRSYAELLAALRARRDQLGVSHECVDEVSGLSSGYASKIFSQPPMRRLGTLSLGEMLAALGLKLSVSEDPEQLERIRRKLWKRKRWTPDPIPVDDTPEDFAWPKGMDFPSRSLIRECVDLRSENQRLQQELDKLRNPVPPLPAPARPRKPRRPTDKARHKARQSARSGIDRNPNPSPIHSRQSRVDH